MNKYNISEQAKEYRWQKFIADEKDRRDKECLKKMLETPEGRWMYMRILEISGYLSSSFTGNSATYFKEGMRYVGIKLANMTVERLGMKGVELKQKAERENIEFQLKNRKYFEQEDK